MRRSLTAAGLLLGLAVPAAGHAAPKCMAETPKFAAGARFAGEVRQIIDGQTLCIGRARDPDTWVRVRLSDLADIKQPDAWWSKATLRRVALGKYAVCTVSEGDYTAADPAPAICRLAGVSIGGRVKKAR